MNRRFFLSAGAVTGLSAMSVMGAFTARPSVAATQGFEVTRSSAEWKAMLSKQQYKVMREEGTERPFSSPLDKNYAAGTYECRGCALPLYASEHKYDSGTGWPSFYQSLPGAIGTKEDRKLFSLRTECHCRRCGSHLGHIFEDGPAPTGKRHCLNGVSLVFKPA
ncbi:MAG: peptide-methionine (R)-S-oxide reductase MsrB [Planktotalea arctica]